MNNSEMPDGCECSNSPHVRDFNPDCALHGNHRKPTGCIGCLVDSRPHTCGYESEFISIPRAPTREGAEL